MVEVGQSLSDEALVRDAVVSKVPPHQSAKLLTIETIGRAAGGFLGVVGVLLTSPNYGRPFRTQFPKHQNSMQLHLCFEEHCRRYSANECLHESLPSC